MAILVPSAEGVAATGAPKTAQMVQGREKE